MPTTRPLAFLRRFRLLGFCLLGWLLSAASVVWAADTTPPVTPVVTDTGTTAVWTQPYTLIFTIASNDPESGVGFFGYNLRQDSPTGTIVDSNPEVYNPILGSTQLYIPGDTVMIGKTYYLEVRVENGVGLWSAWGISDGIQVVNQTADTTPATTPIVTDDGQYTSSTTQLHASWTSSDAESGITEYQYQIHRDMPTGPLVIDWTSTGTTPSVTQNGFVTGVGKERIAGLFNGHLYYFAVKAKNGAGLWSAVGSSDGIKVDKTPPAAVTVTDDGATTTSPTTLHAVWTASTDAESGVNGYQYQIRQDSTTGALIRDWTSAGTGTQVTATGLTLTNNTSYTIGVRAINGSGLSSGAAFSDGILIQVTDTTPPTAPGQPTEGLPDIDVTNATSYTVYWPAATDPESGISCYQLEERVGASISSGWTVVGACQAGTSRTLSGRTDNLPHYYQVKAQNGAGLQGAYSTMSDGILVDTAAPALSAIGVTNITGTGASLNWTTNEAASCVVRCGTSPSPTTQCATTPSGTTHATTLSTLNGSTLYYIGVGCTDAAGNASATAATSFTTAAATVPTQPSVVTINGRQLLLQKRNPDGTLGPATPYIIRGVDWSPASKDTNTSSTDANNVAVRRKEFGKWYQTDLPLLKTMNVNTVRTFMDLGLPGDSGVTVDGKLILDELYRNGIMVIMTVDDSVNNTTRAQQAVNYYKSHPAILAWSLGSEWNINRYFGVAASVPDAAQRTQTAAALIKTLESMASRHPVVSSYGEIDFGGPDTQLAATQNYINNVCTSVDVWSLNLYRGDSFGALWTQWASISTKPMFLGEFGVDAFHATSLVNPAPGTVNEAEQASWDLLLWNDIARHLSAQNPAKMALGGTIFEWNDEWWKVSPPGSQQTSGWFSGGFPDGMGNEEYFGIVGIDRTLRQVYPALQNGFRPDYVPPPAPTAVTFRVVSRGNLAEEYGFQYGVARFYQGGTLLYEKTGGGGGGRSFNIAAISPSTGALVQPITNFDVWYNGPTAVSAMQSFVNGLPNGTLVLIAVADEAGLTVNHLQPCTPKPYQYVQDAYQLMEGLGSTQIRNYCYWGSWALAAVKGQGTALAEGLKNDTIGDPPGELVELTVPFNLQSP